MNDKVRTTLMSWIEIPEGVKKTQFYKNKSKKISKGFSPLRVNETSNRKLSDSSSLSPLKLHKKPVNLSSKEIWKSMNCGSSALSVISSVSNSSTSSNLSLYKSSHLPTIGTLNALIKGSLWSISCLLYSETDAFIKSISAFHYELFV